MYKEVAIFGNENVGKTQLLNRMCNKAFNENYDATVNVDFRTFGEIVGENQYVSFLTWDASGQERFRMAVKEVYFRTANLGLFVCSANNNKSLEDFDGWANDYIVKSSNNNIIVALNKCDLSGNTENISSMCNSLIQNLRNRGFKDPENRVIAVSAKDNVNIDKLVDCIINHTVLLPQETKFVSPYEEYDDEQENIGHKEDEPEQKNTNKKTVTIGLIGTAIFGGVYTLYKKYISKIIHKDKSATSNNVDSDSKLLTA